MNIPYIIITVLVGLTCGILGYFLGKMNSKKDVTLASALQADLDVCKAHTKNLTTRIHSLEADIINIKTKSSVADGERQE
ncbi:hypothetical protein [Flavobacterium reichenbachii]|uniref:hypothetical protein n=1 Tax=Flavobacterium reichenbachii TaxID=362418 RepID=UPI0006900B2E|nr:hypothetical protein [Flavobacterium reichenbachii]OXB09858.1 hypothetical protein B0A68_23240 [Flavobacterium reichenbachii]